MLLSSICRPVYLVISRRSVRLIWSISWANEMWVPYLLDVVTPYVLVFRIDISGLNRSSLSIYELIVPRNANECKPGANPTLDVLGGMESSSKTFVDSSVRPSVCASVRLCVRPSVRPSVRASVRASVHPVLRLDDQGLGC